MRPVCTQDELADPYRMHLYKRRWAELKPISTRVVSQYGQRLSAVPQCLRSTRTESPQYSLLTSISTIADSQQFSAFVIE